MRYEFGKYSLDVDRRELRRGDARIALEPQVFDLIVYLIRNRDRVVGRQELITEIWGGRIVSDSAITTRINAARRVLGDTGAAQAIIRTAYRRGVRFVADLREVDGAATTAATDIAEPPLSIEEMPTDEESFDQVAASQQSLLLEVRGNRIDLMGTLATAEEIGPCVEIARSTIERMIAGCAHSNLHRALHGYGEDYRAKLDELAPGKPAISWYMAAHGIELYYANYVAASKYDPEEHPQMDPVLATQVDIVIAATAALARLFPEIAIYQDRIRQYSGDQRDMRTMVRDLVDPNLSTLAVAADLLTPRAKSVVAKAAALDSGAAPTEMPAVVRAAATKAGLLHSSLAVIAKLVVDANASVGTASGRLATAARNQTGHLRDNIRTKAGYDLAKALTVAGFRAVVDYVTASAGSLSALAARWPEMFRFVNSLLRLLGLGP